MDRDGVATATEQPAGNDAAEQALWDRLVQDHGDDAGGQEPEGDEPETVADDKPAETEPEAEASEPEADDKASDAKAKLPAEEIEKRYRNLQGALGEERAERKKMAETVANMKTVIRHMLDQGATPKPAAQAEAPKVPDVHEDPVGFFMHKIAEQERVIEELRNGTKTATEQVQRQQQEQQFWGLVERSEVEARQRVTDYDDAVRHLEMGRIAELEVMLPDDSPEAQQAAAEAGFRTVADLRAHTLNMDRIAVAQQALRMKRSPAALYYELAHKRGYQPKQAASKVTPVQATKAGQAASKTLSAGRGETNGAMTLDDLADLYLTDPDRADKEFRRAKERGLLG